MSEQAQVGDTVRLTIIIEGEVGNYDGFMRVGGRVLDGSDRSFEILSHAAPPLPIEPGFYLTIDETPEVWELTKTGNWLCGKYLLPSSLLKITNGNQLTRLEPASETAKKVLDAIWHRRKTQGIQQIMDELTTDFGVKK